MRVKNIVVLSGFPEFSRTIIPESSTVLQGFQHLIHISRIIYFYGVVTDKLAFLETYYINL
jgi:hypothetical protein